MAVSSCELAVVGTAGRGKKLSAHLFDRMVDIARAFVHRLHVTTLVSGGAAWADHVAVRLFNEGSVDHLHLKLPCAFVVDATGQWKFEDNRSRSWQTNPGRSANKYHHAFSNKMGCSTMDEIHNAIEGGASVEVFKGFFARNAKVACTPVLLAFTWSTTGAPPEKGGTRHTWNRAIGCKIHVSLEQLNAKSININKVVNEVLGIRALLGEPLKRSHKETNDTHIVKVQKRSVDDKDVKARTE